jgi:hypothetical protein
VLRTSTTPATLPAEREQLVGARRESIGVRDRRRLHRAAPNFDAVTRRRLGR